MAELEGKKVILGVTGGIAAYKAAELVRLLVKAGAYTRVAMTANAAKFVSPLTFEALSGNRVISDMWAGDGSSLDHIEWAQGSELIVIAPATANFIAKVAHGIGDDFLSTMVLAATARILVCPSMNSRMLENSAVQANLSLIKERGISVMEAGQGGLACRTEGPGRLPEPADILEKAAILMARQDLDGLKIMVTAGPTIEPIDPVRYITNRATGKMGYSLARAAARRGARVVLVSGPTGLEPPQDLVFSRVDTAEEMRERVLEESTGCDAIIMAAAVSDYRPETRAKQKMKKGAETVTLELARNPDILAELGREKEKHSCVLVGFAAETQDLLANARKKMKAKNVDLMVANDVGRPDAGFAVDTNFVKIISRDGEVEEFPLLTKIEVADLILDRVKALAGVGGQEKA